MKQALVRSTGSEDFARMVKHYADTDSTEVIENASMEHALILVRYLFIKASQKSKEVRIVSGRLFEPFYSRLIDTIGQVLEKSKVVVLILAADQIKGNSFVNRVKEHPNGKVGVLDMAPDLLSHFVVVGDRSYRIEMDDERKMAHACFNDSIVAPSLVRWHLELQTYAKWIT